MSEKPNVAIIGDGNVGSALTKGLKRAGYRVETVGNKPEKVREIAQGADLVIFAVPSNALRAAVEEAGDLSGKAVVDVSNVLDENYGFAGDIDESNAERVKKWAEGAHVVKAFNTVFAQTMSEGEVHGEPLTVFAASDDDGAKQQVLQLARDIGFDAIDAGPLEHARWLETLGFFNIKLGYGQKLGADAGFRFVHKDAVRKGAGEASRRPRARTTRSTSRRVSAPTKTKTS